MNPILGINPHIEGVIIYVIVFLILAITFWPRFRKTPNLWTLEDLLQTCSMSNMRGISHANINNKWVWARPEGYWSFRYRVRCAWLVFTGKVDAVIWPEVQ